MSSDVKPSGGLFIWLLRLEVMNSLINNFVFYIMQIVCSEGILLGGSNLLDKAQIEKSVFYPAFFIFRMNAE